MRQPHGSGGAEGQSRTCRAGSASRCDLVTAEREISEELTVDPNTNLVRRYRAFAKVANGTVQPITDLWFEYYQVPPAVAFNWQPPKGVPVVDKRHK